MKKRREEKCRFIDISRYILFMPEPHTSGAKTFPNKAPFLYPARSCRPTVTQMRKQPRCFVFKKLVATPLISGENGNKMENATYCSQQKWGNTTSTSPAPQKRRPYVSTVISCRCFRRRGLQAPSFLVPGPRVRLFRSACA